MSYLAVIGAGGHGKVVADAAFEMGCWSSIIFYDDSVFVKEKCLDFKVVGTFKDLVSSVDKFDFVVAIGDNALRLEKSKYLRSIGHNLVSVVHPSANISRYAHVGDGTVCLAGSIISAGSYLSEAVIVNTNASVDHDCRVFDGVHICPGVKLAGNVEIGECSWIGIGASVIQSTIIGKNVTVGAGSAVITNLSDGITAVGVPAKILKS
ncbi:acetyltransferase [Glaciecola sp. SC05]|uniref:acetyltransferase n=1 Tax=Glaciecola sp. SC05 TaxID=1987355 RepID=UPI003528C7F6